MDATQALDLDLLQVRPLLQAGTLSSHDLAAAALQRAEAVQPLCNAFIDLQREAALAAARQADREPSAGALSGIPIALKDMFYRRGQVSTCGSALRQQWRASSTATVVQRLDAAGAVCLGTLNMTEFAYGPTGQNAFYGDARNPWNPQCISGGSSSGAAIAVATRSAFATLGSDTAGSVRMPAALCGITGLKTTYGLVPRSGCMPLSANLDTVGPLTRSVLDNAHLLDLIAGNDNSDPACLPFASLPRGGYLAAARAGAEGGSLAGLRIGLPRGYFDRGLAPVIERLIEQAAAQLEAAGAQLVTVKMPNSLDGLNAAAVLLNWGDVLSLHGRHLQDPSAPLSAQTRGRMEVALGASAQDYTDALRYRGLAVQRFAAEVFGRCDLLLAPVLAMHTPALSEVDVSGGPAMMRTLDEITRLTRPANMLGIPALALPCGFTPAGMPVGLQLMGRPFSERLLYRVGAAYQARTGWHRHSPTAALLASAGHTGG
ncbi:amidase family protein [Pseudomonas sp. NPDC007930]|uniref:amidase n=1 Tax=Pseudomonas sp. NPDC007930 TaxID=3364417 RepID=UPI0036E63AFC